MGFAAAEKTERVASVLGPAGLTRGFARLVVILGHGSTSSEQPARIGPRLRSVRGTARRPQRAALRGHGQPARSARALARSAASTFRPIPGSSADITTPAATTWSSTTSMRFPPRTRPIWIAFASRSKKPGRGMPRSAPGDSNRAPLTLPRTQALRHVEERSEHLAQPRPEYGHCTNAVCIVGRRSLTRGLFLDRRAFLVSYDATQDPDDQKSRGVAGRRGSRLRGHQSRILLLFRRQRPLRLRHQTPSQRHGPGGRDGWPRQRLANRIALANGRDPRAGSHALRDRDDARTSDQGSEREPLA